MFALTRFSRLTRFLCNLNVCVIAQIRKRLRCDARPEVEGSTDVMPALRKKFQRDHSVMRIELSARTILESIEQPLRSLRSDHLG